MKTAKVNPLRQHLQRTARYTIATVAGVLFAYVAWAPQPPPGTEAPEKASFELPPTMLEALREEGLMAPNETTIPPPVAEDQQAALNRRSSRTVKAFTNSDQTDQAEQMGTADSAFAANNANELAAQTSAHSRAPPA